MNYLRRYISYIFLILVMVGCHDDIENIQSIDAPDMAGEPVAFASGLRMVKKSTRAPFSTESEMNAEMLKYHPVVDQYNESTYLYTFNISMFSKNAPTTMLGSADYQLAYESGIYANDGTLALKYVVDESAPNQPLYWPDNSNQYGFSVKAGRDRLDAEVAGKSDQSDATSFYDNDLLKGFGFEPLWDEENSKSYDDLDALNFRSSREWYAVNKRLYPTQSDTDWRKVPLYLKHQRCWVTVKLKAGKGVPRELITFAATNNGFSSKMFSYGGSTVDITPWRTPDTVEYDKDKNGPADPNGQTISLHAIVEPHDFLETIEQPMLQFELNTSKYEFYPSNDLNFATWNTAKDKTESKLTDAEKEAIDAMQAYNLEPGKHLTITATLTTDRIILITALLEDWEDITMSSICDDYGKNGDPIIISNKTELLAFLNNQNKPGEIGLISANEIDLDEGNQWEPRALNCMLNLAGGTLKCHGKVFTDMSVDATLINGTIHITGSEPFMAAIADNNRGNIEQINVTVEEDNRKTVYATKGGMVGVNYGSIIECTSDLQVKGTSGYIGGIAGESKKDADLTTLPIIDQCVVNVRVGATSDNIYGVGGIAGYAEGRISRCYFTYGMTLTQQNNDKYRNIVQATRDISDEENASLRVNAYGNSWPTMATNTIGTGDNSNNNIYSLFNAVIDSEEELRVLLESTDHGAYLNPRYRLADDFEVHNSWDLGIGESGDYSSAAQKYNLNFELDGNDKTITTHGKRLFSHINGYFHDMTIYCAESIVTESLSDATDMISPFAYSVNRTTSNEGEAKIEKIMVKMASGTYVQAAQPAGLICWAFNGATIEDCEVKADLRVVFHSDFNDGDAQRFAGGIAACSIDAIFRGCQVHTGTQILQAATFPNSRHMQYRGGIVGGISTKIDKDHSRPYIPKTIIEDCNSWWDYGTLETSDSPAGTLIGATKYVNVAGQTQLGLAVGQGGNWWTEGRKAASDISNDDAIKTLGKRNSVTPSEVWEDIN